jgi:hypothetical protein
MSLKAEGKFVILTIFSMVFILSLIAIQPSALSTNAKNIHSSEILSTNIFNSIESFLGKIFGISQTTPTFGTPGVSTAASTFSSTFHTTTSTSTVHTTTSTSTVHTTTTTSTVHTTTSTSSIHTTTSTTSTSTSLSTASTIYNGQTEPVTLQTTTRNSTNALRSWSACFNYTYNGLNPPKTCIGGRFGTTNSVLVPYGSEIDYICASVWNSSTVYGFVNWSGTYPLGQYTPQCFSGNGNNFILGIYSPTNVIVNFASVNVTLQASPSSAAYDYGICFKYTYEGLNPPQACIGAAQSYGLSNTIAVPYNSTIDYICTANWVNATVPFTFTNWAGIIPIQTTQCAHGSIAQIT